MFPYFRNILALLMVLSLFACAGSPRTVTKLPGTRDTSTSSQKQPEYPEYLIGVGDALLISVWKDDALTRQVSVLPDGTISFPLIGQLHVDGLPLSRIKDLIQTRLSRYIPDVTLSVQVLQALSQVVYVIGKVNRPGRFELAGNMSVIQALAVAGGLNPFAKSKRIKVFRYDRSATLVFPFNFEEVAAGEYIDQNIPLERGDVIVVP